MPFEIIRNDITRMKVDAIVNAANSSLLGGGGVDGMIHRAAGPELLEECRTLGGCPTGGARITRGYRLPARYVIHTVGPVWRGGSFHERELLSSCYRSSLNLALENGCESVAFPMISAGAYGYPKDEAMEVAVEAITRFLLENEMIVFLVVFGPQEFFTGKKLFRDVKEYIDDQYAERHLPRLQPFLRRNLWRSEEKAAMRLEEELLTEDMSAASLQDDALWADAPLPDAALPDTPLWPDVSLPDAALPDNALRPDAPLPDAAPRPDDSLPDAAPRPAAKAAGSPGKMPFPDWKELLKKTDEGFSQALLRLIDERGMTDSQCYRKANVDRRLFSKIRSDPEYRPSKPTVMAFAMALELSLPEARSLLDKAGFSLSRSSRFDIILEYFLNKRFYDVTQINMVLFDNDLPLLGSGMNF